TSSTSTPPPTTSPSASDELPPAGSPSPMLITDETISRPAVPSGGGVTIPLTTLPASYDVNSAESPGYLTEVAALTQPSVYFVDPLGAVALDTDVVEQVTLKTSGPQQVEYHINPKATW